MNAATAIPPTSPGLSRHSVLKEPILHEESAVWTQSAQNQSLKFKVLRAVVGKLIL